LLLLIEVMKFVFDTLGEVVVTITTNEILLIPIGVTVAGAAIGLAKSLMGTRRKRR